MDLDWCGTFLWEDPICYDRLQFFDFATGNAPSLILHRGQEAQCKVREQAVTYLRDRYSAVDPNVVNVATQAFQRDCSSFAAQIQQSPPTTLATSK